MSADENSALVSAASAALARNGSNKLTTRGLQDVETAEQTRSSRGLPTTPENRKQGYIFVVDDDEAVRAIICAMSTSAGYKCREFPGGLEALAALESGQPCELLLTDLLNAPMDGITLLERMSECFPNIPVVVATAVHDAAVAKACIRNGAFDYLLEPFERQELLDVIHRALETTRLPAIPLNNPVP